MCFSARLSLQIPVLNMPDVPSNFRIVFAFEEQMVKNIYNTEFVSVWRGKELLIQQDVLSGLIDCRPMTGWITTRWLGCT
jgi:hypothetical protein